MRALWVAVGTMLLALAAVPADAGLHVTKLSLAKKTSAAEITVDYPRTGVATLDTVLKRFADERFAEYRADSDHDKSERPYAFELTYAVVRNDSQIFAVQFNEYSDSGGAHPNTDFYAFNFLMPDGAQIFLPEIVDGPRGIARISRLAIADLHKQMDGPDSMSDDDWLKRGAGPLATNFKVFILKPKAIDIVFPSYQVAAYAAGPQAVTIPLAALNGYLRKDWRAPQPSFACSRAATPIEHTICGNAALSRMDRQAAELYAEHLANAYEKKEGEAWRNAQRSWLAARNADCKDGSAECLRKAYAARLAALKKYNAQ